MTDATSRISPAERRVGRRTLAAGEARVVTIARRYCAPVPDVWDACTDPDRIARWFLPVTGELRLGGRYRLAGNAEGTVESCDPPRSFAATWEYGGEVSWIEVQLTERGEDTRFQLEHIAHVDDERWTEFGPGAVGVGWDLGLLALTEYLTTGRVEMDETWSTTPDGVRFVTASSEAWYAAAVAAGTDEAQARAAADRTTAAYTGVA